MNWQCGIGSNSVQLLCSVLLVDGYWSAHFSSYVHIWVHALTGILVSKGDVSG